MPFIVWDFLKMFTVAIVYGVCISLVAAGIALFLAAHTEPDRSAESTAYPMPAAQSVGTAARDEDNPQNRI